MHIYMIWICICKYIQIYVYICIYHFFVRYHVCRQCQWDTSWRSRRELSNAVVKSDFRLTDVEIWPFPFRNGPASVTWLIVIWFINVIKQFQLQHWFNVSLLMLYKRYHCGLCHVQILVSVVCRFFVYLLCSI